MTERELRRFEGWMSTEGSLPPEPSELFEPPELFTDADGRTFQFGGRIKPEYGATVPNYFYFIPGSEPDVTDTKRIWRQEYIEGVLQRREHEEELAKDARQDITYNLGYPHLKNGK